MTNEQPKSKRSVDRAEQVRLNQLGDTARWQLENDKRERAEQAARDAAEEAKLLAEIKRDEAKAAVRAKLSQKAA
jgi:hypothetical protein